MAKAERRQSFLDRAIEQAIGDNVQLGRQDDPARELYPELWAWLSTTEVPGNRVKEPATLTIRLGPEGALVSLNDRALGYSVDVACQNLQDALPTLEKALTSDSTLVRRNTSRDPKVRKRKSL